MQNTFALDNYDHLILSYIQDDARISWTALAEKIHLSPSATMRRVASLEQAGVITGYSAEVSNEALGYEVHAFIEIHVERSNTELADAFLLEVQNQPEIIRCYMVSGNVDFLLEVVAPNLKAYGSFMSEHLLRMQGVKDASSRIVLSAVKPRGKLVPPATAEGR